MNGDFSRDSFDRRHRFSRVLLQQGRVLLDADWNEQTSILLHYIRTLAADLLGPHGGPGDGFRVECDEEGELRCDFRIGRGHYYVDGILCENEPPAGCPPPAPGSLTYGNQPHYPLDDDERELEHDTEYFVYLDVWERHLTHVEAGHIREVALGGPDTATRTQVVWQVKVLDEGCCTDNESLTCADLLAEVMKNELPRCLRARARVAEPSTDPCVIPPEASYRGAENQSYRVEIHDGGTAGAATGATFKWSRENGSVVFALRSLQGSTATVDTLGPDQRRTLVEGDWVEIVDDRSVLRGQPGILAKVDSVDRVRHQVRLSVASGTTLPVFGADATTHPLLRRWEGGAARPVQAGKWIDLEDGVQVWFEPGGTYQTGDYWVIPARTATGDVLWPTQPDSDGTPVPQALPPRGVEHHYAPLGRISLDGDGVVTCVEDCRCVIPPLCGDAADGQRTDYTIEYQNRKPIAYDTRDATDSTAAPAAAGTSTTPAAGTTATAATGDPLLAITGLGGKRADLLRKAGRNTPADVAAMSVEEIQAVLSVSASVAEGILKSARTVAEKG